MSQRTKEYYTLSDKSAKKYASEKKSSKKVLRLKFAVFFIKVKKYVPRIIYFHEK